MAAPARTRITAPFGRSPEYFDGTVDHGGNDHANRLPDDTPAREVYAIRAGTVAHVGWVAGWAGLGLVLQIDHGDGVVSWSCHLAASLVSEGDRVTEGQHVATMGASATTVIHLHFEVRVNGARVNPTPYYTSTAGGGFEPFNPEGNNDMQTILERGIDTGFMVTYPTPRGIERVVIDSIANARGVVEQATRSKIVQMYPADFDAFVRVFGPILAPSPGSGAGAAAVELGELLAAIDELPTASETADEFYRRLKS